MTHELVQALRTCPATRHAALLQRVIERPDDRSRRVALADALRASGEPWADLVLLQLEWDPLGEAERDRRRDLLARQAAILRACPALHAAVAGTSSTRGAMAMRGGLVEQAELPAAAWLESAAEIYRLTPLRDLQLFPMSQAEAIRLSAAEELAHVRSLRLSTPELGDQGIARLVATPSLAGLVALDLHDVGLTDEGAFALAGASVFRALGELHLSNCKLSAAAIGALASSPRMRALRALHLEGHWIDDAVVSTLAGAGALGELRELTFIGGHLGTSLARLASSPLAARLGALIITATVSHDQALIALGSSLGELRSLHLAGVRLGDAAGAFARGKPRLEKLALRGVGMSAEGAVAWIEGSASTSLGSLDLSENALGDRVATALTGAPFAPGLTRLSLEDCAISAAGAAALVSGLPHLVKLDLGGNPLGDQGARTIAGAAQMAGVAHLSLVGCGIGPAGGRALLESPHLARARIVLGRSVGKGIEQALRARRAAMDPMLDV